MANADALKKWHEENRGKKLTAKTPWDKLRENPKSMRAAINAKCADCRGWQEGFMRPVGIVSAIRHCERGKCPLFSLRPYQLKD